MKVAVVGATGMVGNTMRKVLEERGFPVSRLIAVASEKSVGRKVKFGGEDIEVVDPAKAIDLKPDIALFSAGGNASMKYAPLFEQAGSWVIDNSSAFRMDKDIALVVPEINSHVIRASERRIIANPNCSTIQLVMALYPLHKAYHILDVMVSTYQSVSGTGANAVMQLHRERSSSCAIAENAAYLHRIDMNVLPHCDVFLENGFTKEEMKMHHETRKIMDAQFPVSATAVRVPVTGGHSESVAVRFEKPFEVDGIRRLLTDMPGVVVQDDPSQNLYPMPLMAEGKDEVFVGRIRKDHSRENTLQMWVVADNLRKGAATNAVQIAEWLVSNGMAG